MANDIEIVGDGEVRVSATGDDAAWEAQELEYREIRERMDGARALAAQLGYDGEVSRPALIQAVIYQRQRTWRECLILGQQLLLLQATTPHGGWLPTLKEVGIPDRSARRFMALAWFAAQNGHVSDLIRRAGSARKAELLLDFDDAEAEYLLQGGQVRGVTIAEIETDSVDVLRAKLKRAEARAEAAEAKYAERDEDYVAASRRADEWRRKAEKILAEKERAKAVPRHEELKDLGSKIGLVARDAMYDIQHLGELVKKVQTVEPPEPGTPEADAYRREMRLVMSSLFGGVEDGPSLLYQILVEAKEYMDPRSIPLEQLAEEARMAKLRGDDQREWPQEDFRLHLVK